MDDLPRSPADVLELSASQADSLLLTLERHVPRRDPFVTVAPPGAKAALVFGDSHGDWKTMREVVARFEASADSLALVGLGDYIDRSPEDCPEGSVANALFLLSTAARYPDRVFLVKGNHELARRIGVLPHSLPQELEQLWGPSAERYARIMGLLERGPLAARTPSGAYLAHAGFVRDGGTPLATKDLDPNDERTLIDLTWSECDAGRNHRGVVPPWGQSDLDRFLKRSGLSVVLRGHDPDMVGRPVYDGRCLTLHTCRRYKRHGGVLLATVPLEGRVVSVRDLRVEDLST